MAITFVNPYNFIPLANDKNLKREPIEKSGGLLSGKIKYTIKTVTPLFIPNTSNDRYFDIKADHEKENEYHKSYDFFSYTDLSEHSASEGIKYTPVIPGSEMRGAVRSLYEALTDSCFSAMDSDAVLSRRTPQRYTPGILTHEKGRWKLIEEVEDYICRDNNDFSKRNKIGSGMTDGSKVSFSFKKRKPGKPIADLNGSAMTGYIIKGNDGPKLGRACNGNCKACPDKTKDKCKCKVCPPATKALCKSDEEDKCYLLMKHNYHVFCAKKPGGVSVSEESMKQFSGVLDLYEQNIGSAYKEYTTIWKSVKNDGGSIPVYYDYVDDKKEILFLSPACITREVYRNTFKKIIGTRYSTCSKETCLCPACQLFGLVNTESGIQKTSSVRFSDLTVKPKEEYFKEPITLEELGQPKLSSMEFYLKKPEVELNEGEKIIVWTYDYYIVAEPDGRTRVVLYDPEVAGRKMYWHSQEAANRQHIMERAKELEQMEKAWQLKQKKAPKDVYITGRNKTVRPVDRDVEFEGYLYFDKISEQELNRLIAILDMSNQKTKGKRYAMKLGAAKPLGFGSIETRVDSVAIRKLVFEDDAVGFKDGEHYNARPSMMEKDLYIAATEANLEILNLDAIDEQNYIVHYPYINEKDALSSREEGFNWFVKNREAFRYKKGYIDINTSSPYPGERKQVPFREYMQALEPLLKTNFKSVSRSTGKRNGEGRQSETEQRPSTKPAPSYELNKVYTGRINGKRSANGNFAKIDLDGGGRASVYDADMKLNLGDIVDVEYRGRNDKNFDKWSLIVRR